MTPNKATGAANRWFTASPKPRSGAGLCSGGGLCSATRHRPLQPRLENGTPFERAPHVRRHDQQSPRRALSSRSATLRICLWALFTISVFGFTADASAADGDTARVQQAVDQYTEAMECQDRDQRLRLFERAEQLFRQIIEGDADHKPVPNADLYVNLGHAALQAERLGPAIVAYRRALALDPQHARARQNLAYARSLLPDWVRYDNTHGLIDSLFFWRLLLTVSQIKICAAICFLLASGLVALSIVKSQNLWRNLAVLPLIAWGIILTSQFLNPDEAALHNVVVVQELPVYTADSENSPPRLSKPLPSGAELKLIQHRDRWTELELPDGRTGWVLSTGAEQIGSAL